MHLLFVLTLFFSLLLTSIKVPVNPKITLLFFEHAVQVLITFYLKIIDQDCLENMRSYVDDADDNKV